MMTADAFDDFHWLNEPGTWNLEEDGLSLTTELETDFWQETFYGFKRDSGHAFVKPVSGDFTATVTVTAGYSALYDQAGLMLRINEGNWIKAGIEYTDGMMHFSVVATRSLSDWSVIPLAGARPDDAIGMRLTRHGDAVRVQYSVNAGPWQLARLTPFPADDAQVGIMACSPQRSGLEVRFRDLTVGPAISRQLHAD